jgi:hypothetical protein
MPALLPLLALLAFASPARAGVTLQGADADEHLGSSVANAGDVDGDGYDDVIVGAPGADAETGRAMLYLGGPTGPALVPALTLYGDPSQSGPYGTAFGSDVAGLGDVNGDGYDDVAIAVGGPGQVQVFHGSASGLAATPATVIGNYGFFGTQIDAAGDVNGDGYADLIIGTPGVYHYEVTGKAYIHLGSASGIDEDPAVTWTGGTDFYGGSGDYMFGDEVAGGGDVDGDGYDDVLVTRAGSADVELYAGSATGPGAAPTQVWHDASGAPTVLTIADSGDLNGDGYDDVVIGSWANGGRIAAYFGGATHVAARASATVAFPEPQELAIVGDLDGDGFDEVAVGSRSFHADRGRVAVFAGSHRGTLAQHETISARSADGLGVVSGAGDTDADGFADLIVGGAYANAGAGQAMVELGRVDLVVTPNEASVTGGASADVASALPRATVTVRVGRDVLGTARADAFGDAYVEGPMPAGIAAGDTVFFSAFDRRVSSGWTSLVYSPRVRTVVAP